MICRTPRVFLSGGITSTFNQEQELEEKKAARADSFVLIKGMGHWMLSFASYLLEREKGSFAILLRREGIKDQKKKKKEGDRHEFFVQKIFLSFYFLWCAVLSTTRQKHHFFL